MFKLSTFFYLFLAFFLFSEVNAQISVGLRAGLINSGQSFTVITNGQDVESDFDNVTGLVVGVPIEIGISDMFAIQAEANFLGLGSSFDGGDLLPETKTRFNVIEIPVLAKLGINTENYTIAGLVGPAFQYLASGRVKSDAIETPLFNFPAIDEKIDFDENEDLNRSNFYGVAGVQLGIPLGSGKFVVDGRYRFSLNDQDASDDAELRTSGISATVGYMIRIGG